MRVLVVEDDPEIADFLKSHLPEEGFSVDLACTGASGISMLRGSEYDVVVLDLNLPDLPGERICEVARTLPRIPPLLILTVVTGAFEKARLLNSGADDYLVKPFSFEELIARMRALLRRSGIVVPDVLVTEDLSLDAARHTVSRGDTPLSLTRKEFALLEYLLRNKGTMVPKAVLVEHVWDGAADPFSSAIETHMANLRRKLGSPALVHTVHGRGYRID